MLTIHFALTLVILLDLLLPLASCIYSSVFRTLPIIFHLLYNSRISPGILCNPFKRVTSMMNYWAVTLLYKNFSPTELSLYLIKIQKPFLLLHYFTDIPFTIHSKHEKEPPSNIPSYAAINTTLAWMLYNACEHHEDARVLCSNCRGWLTCRQNREGEERGHRRRIQRSKRW